MFPTKLSHTLKCAKSSSTGTVKTVFQKVYGNKPKVTLVNRWRWNLLGNTETCLITDFFYEVWPKTEIPQVLLKSLRKHGYHKSVSKQAKLNFLNRMCWNLWEKPNIPCVLPNLAKDWDASSYSTRATNTVFKKYQATSQNQCIFDRMCWQLWESTKICLICHVSFHIWPETGMRWVLLKSGWKHGFQKHYLERSPKHFFKKNVLKSAKNTEICSIPDRSYEIWLQTEIHAWLRLKTRFFNKYLETSQSKLHWTECAEICKKTQKFDWYAMLPTKFA